ncbi:DnaJ domain-containing protein [Sneathiella sp. P13V-1]|uniref:J domain-containing protein n=1 Tax=Sneathiella sp. P13V-1 TaxID=2697366 RepID=UPI00187B6295|nr:DnaJ domain-containing protein [Sneathiella sp. P13V-1]MBE7636838.1 DnaJ domain-containing protein [Sneathiella sp. P13V-1]
MLGYFIFGAALLLALIVGGQAIASAKPSTLLKALRIVGLVLFSSAAAYFAVTARYQYAMGFGAAALFCLRNKPFFSSSTQNPGQQSGVSTDWLEATLDHDSGEMNASINKGVFAGKKLSDLSYDELQQLLKELERDEKSVAILQAYLNRYFAGESKTDEHETHSGTVKNKGMSKDEAYEILELSAGATLEEIKAAHRRLVKKFHPDRGGSAYMTTKINQARDILIKS